MTSISPERLEAIKQISPILTAAAALIVALASFVRPESSARKVYDQHKADVADLAKVDEHTRQEVEGLRSYLVKEASDPTLDAGLAVVAYVMLDASPRGQQIVPVSVITRKPLPPAAVHPLPSAAAPVPYRSVTGASDSW